ncbi:TPA: hypothetical protein ACG0AT_000941 [Elizabethkingia anophelis]
MKTLEQIKNEVAIEFGYYDFHNSTFCRKTDVKICDEISKRYAREVAQASLEKASESLVHFIDTYNADHSEIKLEITDEQNIVML